MSYQWILLALFFVAIISATVASISRSVIKNALRLGSVILAFLVAFVLQLCGVFQGIVTSIVNMFDLGEKLGEAESALGLVEGFISTVACPVLFITVFLFMLLIFRIVISIVMRVFEKRAEENAATEAIAEGTEVEEEKPKKKKRVIYYKECVWKKILSVAAGLVSGLLVLSVLLMPVFYTMSLATAASHSIDGSDASDSQVYKIVDVVDEHITGPYEESFVAKFYSSVGLTSLMNYTARAGGKIQLEDGGTAYADDVIKNVLKYGVAAAAEATSAVSEHKTVRDDMNHLVTDPVVAEILTSVIMNAIEDLEMKEPAEDDLLGGIAYKFLEQYKSADKATIARDLETVGDTVGVLAEDGVILHVMLGDANFEELLSDEKILGDIIEALSTLSAFDMAVEDAFTVGIDVLGETLHIPETDKDAYDVFMNELLTSMVRDTSTKFDINTIRYYVYTCATKGLRVSASNGVKGHSQFVEYVAHWEKVQSAFAHASEDRSYGYFTIEINGEMYVYDKSKKNIIVYSEESTPDYKTKVSPLAGIINALTLRSSTKQPTRENVYAILEAYVASAKDEVSVELATRILAKDGFVSRAVTIEKLLSAMSFKDWTDEEKAADSRLCAKIISELLSLMDHIKSIDTSKGTEGATELLGEFELLGAAMDDMKKTSCIKDLPSLLIEGIVKNDIFSKYMKPSIAFQINEIVENNNKTYAECMKQIAGVLKWAISTFGGELA